jgi:DMSO/TMAO reductase YedYZ molybdopterin-dependent catalytic subunit
MLPPGQRRIDHFPRFGLPVFAARRVVPPACSTLRVAGDVRTPAEVAIADFGALPRLDQRSDFHCVTTWTRCDLAWSGWRFRDVYEDVLVPLGHPDPGVGYVLFEALDGFRTGLPLEDALANDVLLADRLEGRPLSRAHGAPLRVIAPHHYAYKSIKHLAAIELRRAQPREVVALIHPRARVQLEERARRIPGVWLRWPYRTLTPLTEWFCRFTAPRDD